MKNFAAACVLVAMLGSISLFAQDSSVLTHPGWSYGVFAGYGNGVGNDSTFRRFSVGGRVGRVLTSARGSGVFRGTFQWDAEATPVEILNYSETTYAAGIAPIIWKWNFIGSGKRKVVPFFEAVGGVLFSADKFPPGDTARVNFQTGPGIGFNIFPRPNRAVTFNFRALHISNASIGNENPGINASLQFQIGYRWFK
jgi:lipid A 3-O-deacylase